MSGYRIKDKIVLGHNNFFGVDHLSSERGQQRAEYFSKTENIVNVIKMARENGAGGMMMSTHERSAFVSDAIRYDADLKENLRIYPLLPYVQKYVTSANEKGMLNVVFDMISGTSLGSKFSVIWNGGKGVISKDINSILSTMMQIELKNFLDLKMEVVFLHDVFADLALALDIKEIFEFYIEEIQTRYNCQAGFATKNFPNLIEKFNKWGIKNPVVMTHFNKIGYHMNPSRELCEEVTNSCEASVMVMGSLASGYLRPIEAYEYLGRFKNLDSVVVGTSSRTHIEETYSAIKQHMT